MNYNALIHNRKSVREFTDKPVSQNEIEKIRSFYEKSIHRLFPEIATELRIFGTGAREALEGAAGYNQFLVGAPQYLVLLSEDGPMMEENAGFMMEDLILKLGDLDLASCWLTFTDSDLVKQALGIDSPMKVVAMAAFGYGAKAVRRLRLNFRSMSNVDITAKHRYMEPKRSVFEMVYLHHWGNTKKVKDYIGFFDDMLWESLYAASLSPSYLNRQAYGFVIHEGGISLVSRPDEYTTEIDGKLSQGIALLHFSVVAESWVGKVNWCFGSAAAGLEVPEGHKVIATCAL